MPWVRVDDHFPDHVKLAELGDLAPLGGWLYLCALAWCNRQLTDGRIPKAQVHRLASFRHVAVAGTQVDAEAIALELVRVGLWDDAGRAYQVHDYDHYQPSKAEVLAERARNNARKHRDADNGRYVRGTGGGTAGGTTGGTGGGTAGTWDRPVPVPDPNTQVPIPKRKRPLSASADAAQPASALAEVWNSHTQPPIPRCRDVNGQRAVHAKARLAERPLDEWVAVVDRIQASDFCRGENDRAWVASFDWLLRPETATRVLEGKYDNRAKVVPKAARQVQDDAVGQRWLAKGAQP